MKMRYEGFSPLSLKTWVLVILLVILHVAESAAQTFEYPSIVYMDSVSLRQVVANSGDSAVVVQSATSGGGFTLKSVVGIVDYKVNVQSPDIGQKNKFHYVILYKVHGVKNPSTPGVVTVYPEDTLSVYYDGDSLKLYNDRSFKVVGEFHRLKIEVTKVFEATPATNGGINLNQLTAGQSSSVPDFVHIYAKIAVQKFNDPTFNMNMSSAVSSIDSINYNGTVRLNWNSLASKTPAGYEVEWTYTTDEPVYDFRNNATRIFTNNTYFNIPVAQKEGNLIYRVRMVRPDPTDLTARKYGPWTLGDQGGVSGMSNGLVPILVSSNDSLNWDLKMNFVEDGKYKQVITYYDGLLKPKQVQTRFNSHPSQTIVAQTLYDYQGRPVINSLPIPVIGVSKFSYISNFLHPSGASEYSKLSYDAIPDETQFCPPREIRIPPLADDAVSNQYYSQNKADKTGKHAFIPDAEGYPMTRKIFAAENSEKVLFEGQAGSGLQLGNFNGQGDDSSKHTEYLYGSPLQAELNRYFGKDIGKSNYYRKMITTDNHDQDMFSITDDEGRLVASGLIGTPNTTDLALSIHNYPANNYFKSNLLPIPNIRMGEHWRNSGSYFVETDLNYSFKYEINYAPFKPCPNVAAGLMPKIYFQYEVIDMCGNVKLDTSGVLGGIGDTSATFISFADTAQVFLKKGNHVWNKHSYIKMEDLTASVDAYLDKGYYCFKTLDQYLKEEFVKAEFPCNNSYTPCAAKRLSMIKEMYPHAKYGKYYYTDSITKSFVDQRPNSIFTYQQGSDSTCNYLANCIPDNIYAFDTVYRIKQMKPNDIIEYFNDSIAAALLPLHPDYCKLQLCELINNPYAHILAAVKKASDAIYVNRFTMDDIVNNDPFVLNNILTPTQLKSLVENDQEIDSIAFRKTICGSEFGPIESACNTINMGKDPGYITQYPDYVQDMYYKTLVELYRANRTERLNIHLEQYGDTCGPCTALRLVDQGSIEPFGPASDTAFLIGGMDSTAKYTNLPVQSSFSNFFDPIQSQTINSDSLDNYRNVDNSQYCMELTSYIMGTLAGCNVADTLLTALEDTLNSRFCSKGNSITALTYDSLTNIMLQVGIASNDLCNAGLADLRRVTRLSNDMVQLGWIHYSDAYYEDFLSFLDSNSVFGFIAGSVDTTVVSLRLCDDHPFEQNFAVQLGATASPSNCSNVADVLMIRTNVDAANSVQLSFVDTNNSMELKCYLYPSLNSEYNALNDTIATHNGVYPITNINNVNIQSLFNAYGFDKLLASYANRNTILLNFEGTKQSTTKAFSYFFSVFNEYSDNNMMEKDEPQYVNGIGCSELIPMVTEALSMAEQLNIKSGHPYFGKYITNVINYKNHVNFDFNNYYSAMQTCGLTDSVLIQKSIAHYKIKFPQSASFSSIENYINTLGITDTVGISNLTIYQPDDYYLLMDVYEAHGKDLKYINQQVQSRLPVGCTIEYMPDFERDTVAQLLSSDFYPIDPISFGAAFPTATISSPQPVTFYHMMPGASPAMSMGQMYTITGNISSNFEYNHYVDSIYRYVIANAPITIMLTHAESAVSPQYHDWQMAAWRDYVQSLPADNHNALIKQSKPDQFKLLSASNGGQSFASSKFSYQNARNPFFQNDLLIDHSPTTNTNYNYINSLLQAISQFNQVIHHTDEFMREQNSSYIPDLVANNTETRTYLCADTTVFWINHFDANSKMINIFVKLPGYLRYPRSWYRLAGVSKGIEKDSITYFTVKFAALQGLQNDTITCMAYTNQNLGETYSIPSAFLTSHSRFETISAPFESCETRKIETLYPAAQIRYGIYRDSLRRELITMFRQHVIDSLQEQLYIYGNDIKHGVTLYYYDMAGNLVMTVPPAGVDTMNVSGSNNDAINLARTGGNLGGGVIIVTTNQLIPGHKKTTSYRHTAQNKVKTTTTPDGGTVEHYYDMLGRVVFTQTAKHRLTGDYTYFKYDKLSRVVETGVVQLGFVPDDTKLADLAELQQIESVIKNKLRREVTATIYDTATYQLAGVFQKQPPQDNLKNRVSCTRYFDAIGMGVNASTDTNYTNALYYSYDVSGNVKTLLHDLRGISGQELRFKRVDYEYDLYSGKVLMVSYNRGKADQFYQKYDYDSDNRIVQVKTSNNGIFWDRDAHYDYYDHGPLARMEIGEQRVQGVDYAYTINGWLKAINGVRNASEADMGGDGASGMVMPKDVFSQRVDYFNWQDYEDYKAIDNPDFLNELTPTQKSLYNGNIAGVATALAPFDNVHKKYHYDPLQRIDKAEYAEYSYNTSTSSIIANNIPDYRSEYRYDADGNLLWLQREGGEVDMKYNNGVAISQHRMDEFTYRYETDKNRLRNLTDTVTSTLYDIDIHTPNPDSNATYYTYDANGNVTKDVVSGLNRVVWNNLGKLKSIDKADGSSLAFTYDPMGNRLTKEMVTKPSPTQVLKNKTLYVRDASGNVLAVYEDKREFDLEKVSTSSLGSTTSINYWKNAKPDVGLRLANELLTAMDNDPAANLAQVAMSIPGLNEYAENSELLNGFVSTLGNEDVLSFVKSKPEITAYSLSAEEPGNTMSAEKISAYLQPVLLSDNLDDLQTDLFVAIKDNNDILYNTTVVTIPATQMQKDDFPADPAMLNLFKGMSITDRLQLTNTLAQSLNAEHQATLPYISSVLQNAYSSNNTHGAFIQEIPNGDMVFDQLRDDAGNYVVQRYALADMGEVPFDTVAAEFKTNGVLGNVLSAEAPQATPEALSLILNNSFDAVMSLAQSSGQADQFLKAVKDVIAAPDGEVYGWFEAWYKWIEVMKTQHHNLAEHHIYGSSRLGLQKYLPDELKYQWAKGQNNQVITTNGLLALKPWYSRYANDMFSPTLYKDSLAIGTIAIDTSIFGSHTLGNRHYELTNHLGNVQATVLDRTTPILEGTTLLGYKADISTAQDYYPFGMLMPGRYVKDTARKCITMNTTVLVPHIVKVDRFATLTFPATVNTKQHGVNTVPVYQLPKAASFQAEQLYVYHFNDASTHPNGVVATASQLPDSFVEYNINLSGEPSGVTAYMHLHTDTTQTEQTVGFEVELNPNFNLEMRVRQYYGTGDEYYDAVGWTAITTAGAQELLVPIDKSAIAAGGPTMLEYRVLTANGTFPDVGVLVSRYYTYISHYTTKTQIATICEEKNNYRFGFNGQEKDNEIKGIGNSLEFSARIYDSRLGRFLSVDPLSESFPWNSTYAFAENRVIDGRDLEGKEWEQFMMRRIVADKGVSSLKVINVSHGNGPIVDATYNLKVKSNRDAFDKLKTAYSTDPGIIHNPGNKFAHYKPMESPHDKDNTLAVGDHMDIDILGGVFKDYVRFTDISISDNSFLIKASTLYGHTDAGTIEFSGSFDSETGVIDFSIHNITTNNVGTDPGIGRGAQTAQWKKVLNNAQDYIGGDLKSKTVHKEIYGQGAETGDGKKVIDEDLQTGSSSEQYQEIK